MLMLQRFVTGRMVCAFTSRAPILHLTNFCRAGIGIHDSGVALTHCIGATNHTTFLHNVALSTVRE